MSSEDDKPVSAASRFKGGVPHYHRSNRAEEDDWDEWTGDRLKSSGREKRERIIHAIGAVFIGCLVLVGILTAIFMVLRKVLPMIE
jgi:hypothetical protein